MRGKSTTRRLRAAVGALKPGTDNTEGGVFCQLLFQNVQHIRGNMYVGIHAEQEGFCVISYARVE